MRKGLLHGVLLAVYALLTAYYFWSPPTANADGSLGDHDQQEQSTPVYPELETGIPRPGFDRSLERALDEVTKELSQWNEENEELRQRIELEDAFGRERIHQYPPGDYDRETIRVNPSDFTRPGPALLRDFGLDDGARRP